MLLPLAIQAPTPPKEPFAVDLFLVGSNPQPLKDLDWLKKTGEEDTPVQGVLRPLLATRAAAKKTFVVIDGGDGSLFPASGPWHSIAVLQREYSAYDSMTETVNGKTRVLERTESEGTMTGSFGIQANGKGGYGSFTFLHFGTGEGHPVVAMMDLNSYRSALASKMDQDRQYLSQALLFSDDPIDQTERFLERTGAPPTGPVLCRTGIPRASDRNVTAFPAEGVVGQYRLVRGDPGWRLEFVRFYGSPR